MMDKELVDRDWNVAKNIASCVAMTHMCIEYLIKVVSIYDFGGQNYWVRYADFYIFVVMVVTGQDGL